MNTIDASISVKWFKKGESHEKEALYLLERIKSFEIACNVNEWLILETVRGLVRASYSKKDIDKAYDTMMELMDIKAIKRINVSEVLPLAKSIERDLNLYAADAVHLATAIVTGSRVLWTEDKHLYKKKVRDFAGDQGLEVLKLERIDIPDQTNASEEKVGTG